MVADSLTKNLPAESFLRHRDVQLGRFHASNMTVLTKVK
jgi:hypothetical protein